MLSVSNLAKVYGDRTLFADVSLMLNAGERYGLVGANGSGKTTLLNILGGEMEPSAGEVSPGGPASACCARTTSSTRSTRSST